MEGQKVFVFRVQTDVEIVATSEEAAREILEERWTNGEEEITLALGDCRNAMLLRSYEDCGTCGGGGCPECGAENVNQ